MPTSTAARSTDLPGPTGARHPQAGFTLIELGLVMLIIGVAIAVIVPRFQDQSRAELTSQTRKLATTFRFLQHEAILNGRVYRLNYDLDQQPISSPRPRRAMRSAASSRRAASCAGTWRCRARQISDVDRRPSAASSEGVAFTQFYPDGYVDPTVVHLDNDQEVYTSMSPTGATAYVQAGYLDLGARLTGPAAAHRGFTDQVLVALTIIAFAFIGLLGLHNRNLKMVANDQDLTRATLLARRFITNMELIEQFPDVGTNRRVRGRQRFPLESDVEETELPTVRKVTSASSGTSATPACELLYHP
jgi:general secretion pathway protein H